MCDRQRDAGRDHAGRIQPLALRTQHRVVGGTVLGVSGKLIGKILFFIFLRSFRRRVLNQSPTISDIGGIQWELLGLMFLSWVIVYFALWKGITQARKVGIRI